MARVFTITPGLENMGALKTGGQGSVYKGRRIGEIITAIKILPTPIYSESGDDKNYTAFQNEVSKLKKVNEIPNPNVVKILSSGITDTGNFPFIEMEYIEGADLEELLKAPNDPIFTIKETLKVAEQLSDALAHCHSMDVRHGDIKSNNVKFSSNTGNYVLLDFGLAIMSDEQRRSSFRQAGAIEFMAPEQNTGQMLFQTDVYSFGIILFELLAGTVPFTLRDGGESARNEVRLAHMVSPLPNLLDLRKSALPSHWNDQKKEHEMQVPEWLVSLIYKCLEKKPEKRFANGIELHNYIVQKFISRPDNTFHLNQKTILEQAKQNLTISQEQLQKQLWQYKEELLKKESELKTLKNLLAEKETNLQSLKDGSTKTIKSVSNKGVSPTSFTILLMLTFALGAFAMFTVFKNNSSANSKILASRKTMPTNSNSGVEGAIPNADDEQQNNTDEEAMQVEQQTENLGSNKKADIIVKQDNDRVNQLVSQPKDQQSLAAKNREKPVATSAEEKPVQKKEIPEEVINPVKQPDEIEKENKKTENPIEKNNDNAHSEKNSVTKKYLIVSRAYFYNYPDENTRRDEFISPLEHAVVQSLDERYGFIYVVITNPQGQVFKGWLRKGDLKLYSIE